MPSGLDTFDVAGACQLTIKAHVILPLHSLKVSHNIPTRYSCFSAGIVARVPATEKEAGIVELHVRRQ